MADAYRSLADYRNIFNRRPPGLHAPALVHEASLSIFALLREDLWSWWWLFW